MLFVFSYQLIKLSLCRPVQILQAHINIEKKCTYDIYECINIT